MVSLLPATATAIGVLVLAQVPSPAELAGVALVIGAIAIHRERPEEAIEPDARAIAA
jgi:inner membrane transporter RhtA